ncbi:MAG: hypothetical protein JXR07_20590 [Reichenbachiella sp.]
MKKYATIPLKKYLFKYICKYYADDFKNGKLVVKKRMVSTKLDSRVDYKRYLERVDDKYRELIILSHDTRSDYLFSFVNHVRTSFNQSLVEYVYGNHHRMTYSAAVREFLSSYQIYESEYSFESAYRTWTRSRLFKNLAPIKPTKKAHARFK